MPPVPSSASSGPLVNTSESLSLSGAKLLSAGAEARAAEIGIGINIAVVDAATHLLHFARTPGAKLTSISTAIDKAFTAAGHRAPTHTYMEAAAFRPGGPAEGIGRTNGGRFVTIGGGVPVFNKQGEVIGAIGASGGTPAQDRDIVEMGVKVFEQGGKSGLRAKL